MKVLDVSHYSITLVGLDWQFLWKRKKLKQKKSPVETFSFPQKQNQFDWEWWWKRVCERNFNRFPKQRQ